MNIKERIKQRVLVDDDALVIDASKCHGSWVVDEHGKEYLDCFSQFASQPIGWNHPKMLAQKEKLSNAALHKFANPETLSEEYAEFVDRFVEITPDFKHAFFIDGGALGVENALKAAFDWKAQKLKWEEDKVNDLKVIHFKQAFHGRTGYTMSLTNTVANKTALYPKFNWVRVSNPVSKEFFLESIENSKRALETNTVAAIIFETIQGEGGDNHYDQEVFTTYRKLADEYDALLILDEVQSGVGMTGKMWAYQHFGIVPDMIAFGKKMQVCGCASTGRIDEISNNVFQVHSRINSTWGGNIVDMVRASIYLDIIKEEKLVENAAQVGLYFLNKLEALGVSSPRGKGLMIAFDLDNSSERNLVMAKLKKKMLALPCGEKSIRFRPHLTFSEHDVDVAIEFIRESL